MNNFINFFSKYSLTLGERVKLPLDLVHANVNESRHYYFFHEYTFSNSQTHAQLHSFSMQYVSKLSKVSITVIGGIDTYIDTCMDFLNPVKLRTCTHCHGASVKGLVSSIYGTPCTCIHVTITMHVFTVTYHDRGDMN